jgi:hypothetical protein
MMMMIRIDRPTPPNHVVIFGIRTNQKIKSIVSLPGTSTDEMGSSMFKPYHTHSTTQMTTMIELREDTNQGMF